MEKKKRSFMEKTLWTDVEEYHLKYASDTSLFDELCNQLRESGIPHNTFGELLFAPIHFNTTPIELYYEGLERLRRRFLNERMKNEFGECDFEWSLNESNFSTVFTESPYLMEKSKNEQFNNYMIAHANRHNIDVWDFPNNTSWFVKRDEPKKLLYTTIGVFYVLFILTIAMITTDVWEWIKLKPISWNATWTVAFLDVVIVSLYYYWTERKKVKLFFFQ
jgi:hypothetical protein